MADFRKLMLMLIAGALLFATAASAAPYSCNATAVPTLVRSEGIAELTGDILLNCDGEPGIGQTEILANVRLRLSTNITSNMVDSSNTDALLILDEGVDVGAIGPTTVRWRGNGASPAASQNIFQAKKISDTEIEWTGVYLVAPGTNRKTIRITNVRGYAAALGDFATIYATINITGSTTVPVDNNLLVVADTRPGMEFSTDKDVVSLKGCEAKGGDPEKNSASGTFNLKFKEGFASAFRPVGTASSSNTIPGAGYMNESGFNPGTLMAGTSLVGLSSLGQANQGTRLMARLKDIPSGVKLKVPLSVNVSGNLVANLVSGLDANGAGAYAAATDGVLSGSTLVYEVTSINASSYSAQETVTIPVDVYLAAPGPSSIQTMSANGVLAPLSTKYTMSKDDPEPRFIDKPGDKVVLNIGPCRTILLFPFITQQANFDTGIAISNTSKDPLETKAQAGTCKLYYYGNTSKAKGPDPQTTPSIPAGGHLVYSLSSGGGVYAQDDGGYTACASGACIAQLFQGYMIAVCDFQYAHGYAFISDYGSAKLAQGYLALVIPDRGQKNRAAQDNSLSAASNQGEQLAN